MFTGKKAVFSITTIVLAIVLTVILLEAVLRIFFPQETLYPRYQFSKEYGFMVFRNARMVNERFGRWKFIYTTNQYQYRGQAVPIMDKYGKTNVVVLGDSYSFGCGVNDGEEYPAVIQEKLKSRFNVINLGMEAWGLTQEIRRYFDFGRLYRPKFVILQFCDNDLDDNFLNLVTTIENNKFVFKDSLNNINWVKKFMSQSIIQNSQVYNLFRNRIYLFITQRQINKLKEKHGQAPAAEYGTKEIDFYIKLLTIFSKELRNDGVTLILISVGHQLERHPEIISCVKQLESEEQLRFYYTQSWLNGVSGYASAQGHEWGKLAHKIIGEQLALIIENLDNAGLKPKN
jgi:lysophospholipase L1-like esterase